MPLAHGKAAYGIAVKTDLGQRLGTFAAQALGHAALLDAEKRMARPVAKGVARALRPPHRQAHRLGHPRLVGRQRGAFVETHDDIGAEELLNLHRPLWRQLVLGAVNVAFEGHTSLGELAKVRERHDLKAARVGQDRLVPVHELVQATQPVDPLGGRAQHQVIGIAQKDIRSRGGDAFGHHRFDRPCCAHGHESRRANLAARCLDHAGARLAVGGLQVKLELCGHDPPSFGCAAAYRPNAPARQGGVRWWPRRTWRRR